VQEHCVRLFLDDAQNLDFHRAFAEEATRQSESVRDLLRSLKLEISQCHGSQEMQLRSVRQVASQLRADTEDLVCLFPTDLYAIVDLQDVLFSRLGGAQSGGRRERLVCAVVHQVLPKAIIQQPDSAWKRIFSVGADQTKMGQLQAAQLLRLMSARARRDRKIVYISGPGHSSATRLRIAGAVETLLRHDVAVEATHAEWDGRKVSDALDDWQKMGGDLGRLDAVAAHNDQMAVAAKDWLIACGKSHIPVVGMDGTDNLGKRLVVEKKLAATVVQPLGVKEVFDIYRRLLRSDLSVAELRADPNVRLSPTSFPNIEDISPLPAH
jgi:hypothetical protein